MSQSQLWFGSARARSSVAAAAPKVPGTSPAPHPRAMIVEDELFIAWHLETLAREFGLDVIGLVPDGEGAIEQFVDGSPDIVFMDINLAGEMDGIETARRIRERGDAAIIFITAYADPVTVARIGKIVPGAQVLSKPVSSDRLRVAVGKALSAPGQ